ncbi:MAG: hypothetical protein J7K30_12475 [Deltaproteobacteria bacterium]|nr:hypothetical protein [Deltaproteobacteria bacterium]
METTIKRYKYSLIACIVIILLLLLWIFIPSGKLNSLQNVPENTIKGALGSIVFNKDGNLALIDNKGEPLKPVELPLKLRGGELKFMTNISMFGVKGSPLRIVIRMGRSTYSFCIDDETCELLPHSACD